MAPVKAADGPWTERIPGVAYVRYRVGGGNMAANNEIQLRILPPPEPRLGAASRPRAVFASYRQPERPVIAAAAVPGAAGSGPTLHDAVFGGIGYSISRAAQALYFVPLAATGGASFLCKSGSKPCVDSRYGNDHALGFWNAGAGYDF